ncbi:20S proteasome alpha subunit E1 [Actinidia rufa]|uniref:Proteasome subunit alpha type n=1 Tax=Actinidia rufa TaxID=165716 RepID=A0A7J0GBH2_9ERIC|nr:20S proteasome alpha subunit E1 [Actinidia rufa]
MFLTRTEYDRGVNTFSPEGRLFQVEYAIEAIKEPSSVEKIMEIDEHIGCAMSGLIADARTLVEHARVETQNHRFSYGEPMTVESTTQALCDLALRFGEGDEESMSRPFGVSLLIAGHDENGPSLYYTDPSGTFWQCNAKAIGSGSEGADSSLQEQYNKNITLKEAETIALSILKQVMEEKVTPNNVDIAKVAPNYHFYAKFWRWWLILRKAQNTENRQCYAFYGGLDLGQEHDVKSILQNGGHARFIWELEEVTCSVLGSIYSVVYFGNSTSVS